MAKRKYLKEEEEIKKLYKANTPISEIIKKYDYIKGGWVKRYIKQLDINIKVESPSKIFNVDEYKDWIME